MNILVLNWRDMKHPEAGGAEVHFQEIFKRLVVKGHQVTLLATRYAGSTPDDVQDGIKVLRWGHTFTFNWEAPFLIKKVMRQQHVDCIIDDVNKIPFFTARWFRKIPSGAFFHHLFGKTIFELTAWPMARYVMFMENLSSWGYGNGPCCTVSNSTKDELVAHGFNPDKITIIENSVNTDHYIPDPAISKHQNQLLYFGRLKKYKNIEIVLKAVQMIKASGRDISFAIAGCGDDDKRLRGIVEELGIAQSVSFLGFVDDAEKLRLYREATLFVNPSLKEGWGITNIEANGCGTAVVANNAPGLRDSVQYEKSGLLYSENDVNDLVRCILFLLDNPHKRREYEAGGRAWALNFSWDKTAERVEQWITKTILAGQQSPQSN